MYRNTYWSGREIEEWMYDVDAEGEAASRIRHADLVDFVVMPPDRGDADSVHENVDIDDNEQMIEDDAATFLNEITGQIEVFCRFDDDNENRPESSDNENSAEASGTAEQGEEPFVVSPPKWSKAMKYRFSKHPVDLSFDKSKMIFDKCGNSLPFVIFLRSI